MRTAPYMPPAATSNRAFFAMSVPSFNLWDRDARNLSERKPLISCVTGTSHKEDRTVTPSPAPRPYSRVAGPIRTARPVFVVLSNHGYTYGADRWIRKGKRPGK